MRRRISSRTVSCGSSALFERRFRSFDLCKTAAVEPLLWQRQILLRFAPRYNKRSFVAASETRCSGFSDTSCLGATTKSYPLLFPLIPPPFFDDDLQWRRRYGVPSLTKINVSGMKFRPGDVRTLRFSKSKRSIELFNGSNLSRIAFTLSWVGRKATK